MFSKRSIASQIQLNSLNEETGTGVTQLMQSVRMSRSLVTKIKTFDIYRLSRKLTSYVRGKKVLSRTVTGKDGKHQVRTVSSYSVKDADQCCFTKIKCPAS